MGDVTQDPVRAQYHRTERMWYLWDGRDALKGDDGAIHLFTTASEAYDWLASGDGARKTRSGTCPCGKALIPTSFIEQGGA